MISAILRLIAVTLGVLVLSTVFVLTARTLGFRQTFSAPPHAWFLLPNWEVTELDQSLNP